MRSKRLLIFLTGLSFLMACTQSTKDSQGVKSAALNSQAITAIQMSMDMKATSTNGSRYSTPPGLLVSYSLDKETLLTRMDLPGAMFLDKKARVHVADQGQKKNRLLLADTMTPDPSVSLDQLAQAFIQSNQMYDLDLWDNSKMFRKLLKDQFIKKAQKKAFIITSEQNGLVTLSRKKAVQDGQQSLKVYFDSAVGAVTQTEFEYTSPKIEYKGVTAIKYVQSKDLADSIIPSEIRTTITTDLVGTARLPKVQLPVSSKKLNPGEEPTLKPDEFIASTWTSPVGEGEIDPNHQETETVIEFKNLKIGQVGPEYFNP